VLSYSIGLIFPAVTVGAVGLASAIILSRRFQALRNKILIFLNESTSMYWERKTKKNENLFFLIPTATKKILPFFQRFLFREYWQQLW
jgi:hypothetical protein